MLRFYCGCFCIAIFAISLGCSGETAKVTQPTQFAPVPTEEPPMFQMNMGGRDTDVPAEEVLALPDQ